MSLKHSTSANKTKNIKSSTLDSLSSFFIYTNILGTGLEVDLCFQYKHLITLSYRVYKAIYLKIMKNAAFQSLVAIFLVVAWKAPLKETSAVNVRASESEISLAWEVPRGFNFPRFLLHVPWCMGDVSLPFVQNLSSQMIKFSVWSIEMMVI